MKIKQLFCACRKAKTMSDFKRLVKEYEYYYIADDSKGANRWWVFECNHCKRKAMFSNGALSLNPLLDNFDKIRKEYAKRDIWDEFVAVLFMLRDNRPNSDKIVLSSLHKVQLEPREYPYSAGFDIKREHK